MKITSDTILLALAMLLTSVSAAAQDTPAGAGQTVASLDSTANGRKVITNAMMIGIGGTEILDTYLSPEKYSGPEIRFISHTVRQREHRKWSRQIVWQGDFAFADNRSGDGNEMLGMLNFSYGAYRNWTFLGGDLAVKAGAVVDASLGFLYNMRNGNNPAQAKASVSVMPSAAAAYRFSLLGKPLTVRYEVAAPLFGLMFSPNYGQSYYEIFSRGNYDHNLVPTTFGSTPSLRHMLTLDFRLLRTTFRVGYLGDYQQAKVNNLKSHTYTHALLIGVVRRFSVVKI